MASALSGNGEKVIRVISEHWIKYVFPCFVFGILGSVSALLFLLAGYTAHHAMWLSHLSFIAALLLFLLTHHWFFTKLLGETMTHVIITNRRVVWIHESIFQREHMVEYAYEKMKTVEAKKSGIVQTVLRYGTIAFESGADIRYVPHPNHVAKEIEQAMGMR